MQTKLQLELLGSLKRARLGSRGWSLMELLIVVSIVGLLSALSLPKILQARAAARAGAVIGEQLGLAKECATWVLSGGVGVAPATAIGRECNLTKASRYEGSWGEFGPVTRGLRCLQVTNWGGVAITIAVSTSGELTCTMGGRRV
jgi:type IV pilus assembly protein PilA